MDETLSEAGEEMKVGNKPEQDPAERDFTTQELLQDLSGDEHGHPTPGKDLELPLASETSNMGMKLMSTKETKRNAFEGNKWMFLNTLDEKAWRGFLSEFDQRVKSETTLEDFKEELWNTVVRFGKSGCLDLMCGSGEHSCDGQSCVRIQSFQKEDLATWFGDIKEKEKREVQIVAEFYTNTTVNIATALGFFSRMCSLQSLETLESEHHLVTALSVESWPGALQITQKHIRGWKIGLEAEMGFPMSEAYSLPVNAKSLVGSVMANLCASHYPLHMAMVEVSSQRILIDKAFSVTKFVRLAQMSHHSHRLLRKILGFRPGNKEIT